MAFQIKGLAEFKQQLLAVDFSQSDKIVIKQVAPIVKYWCTHTNWVEAHLHDCPDGQERAHIIHQGENGGLMVLVDCWSH